MSTGIDDKRLKLWNLSERPPSLQQSYPEAQDMLAWASLGPDGRWLAALGREQLVRLYPVSGGEGYSLPGHEKTVFKALFSPDGRQLLTASGDGTVRAWDLETRSELCRLPLPTEFNAGNPSLWDFDFRCTPHRLLDRRPPHPRHAGAL